MLYRQSAFWGDDAECDRLGRWETIRPKWGYGYSTSGGGTRFCPGYRYGFMEVGDGVGRVVQGFKSRDSGDDHLWKELLKMRLVDENGVQVLMVLELGI